MKSTAPVRTHHHASTAGVAPWKLMRPYKLGKSKIKVAYCSPSVGGSAEAPTLIYGSPASLEGDPLPDMRDYSGVVYVSTFPGTISVTLDIDDTTPPVSFQETATAQFGVSYYQDGERFLISGPSTYWSLTGTAYCTGRIFSYGGSPIRRAGTDATSSFTSGPINLYGFTTQAWDPPYEPDQMGLTMVLTNGSASVGLDVMLMWAE